MLLSFVLSPLAFAADVQVIADDHPINLEGLKPLSSQLIAILAYHAMLAGTGCPAVRDDGDHATGDGHLHCDLTDALGLGYQCSSAHTGIVKQWFGKNLRALFDDNTPSFKYAMKKNDLQWICESTPDGASAHSTWVSLRVRTHADRVTVDGEISSINRNDKVGIYGILRKVHFVYKICADSVEVLSHTN